MTEKTIILDSENFHHLLEAQEVKKNINGVKISISLSVFDIPKSLTVNTDEEQEKMKLTFHYIDNEKAIEQKRNDTTSIFVGENSGKLMGLLINYGDKNPQRIPIEINEFVEKEIPNLKRENQRLNYGLIKELVASSEVEPLLA